MRKFLFATVAGAAMTLAAGASHASVISYQILDGSTVIGSGSNPTGGSIKISGSDANFSVDGNASASPFLPSPNFSTNNFTTGVAGAQKGTVTIKITETGLSSFSGNIMNTFTLNSLTSPTFTTGTISNYFDASNTAFGTGLLLGTATFAGSDSFSSKTPTSAAITGPFSETTIYTLNFAQGAASSMSSSSQLVATPEPASLSVLGLGLAGVGFLRRRRRA